MKKDFESCSIGFLINYTARQSHKFFSYEAEKLGLNTGAIFILKELNFQDGLCQNVISKKLRVDKALITRTVCKLIDNELVEKKSDAKDGRVTKIFLTDKGKQIMPKIHNIFRGWNKLITKELEENEVDFLHRMMVKISNNVKFLGEEINEK